MSCSKVASIRVVPCMQVAAMVPLLPAHDGSVESGHQLCTLRHKVQNLPIPKYHVLQKCSTWMVLVIRLPRGHQCNVDHITHDRTSQ